MNFVVRYGIGRAVSPFITTRDRTGAAHGLTVSAFCSVSLDPPLVLVCVDKRTGSHAAFLESNVFIVNVLRENQRHISQQFAAKIADKFECIDCQIGIDGVPLIAEALVNLECRLVNQYDGGDHTIFIGQIENSNVCDGKPLLYFDGAYGKLKD